MTLDLGQLLCLILGLAPRTLRPVLCRRLVRGACLMSGADQQQHRQQVERAWAQWTLRPRYQGWGHVVAGLVHVGAALLVGLFFTLGMEQPPPLPGIAGFGVVIYLLVFRDDLRGQFRLPPPPASPRPRGGRDASALLPMALLIHILLIPLLYHWLVPDPVKQRLREFVGQIGEPMTFVLAFACFSLAVALLLHVAALTVFLLRRRLHRAD